MKQVMIRLLSLSLLLTLAVAAPAAAKPIVGVGDQNPSMFSDPSFQKLGVKHSRLVLAWDWYKHPPLVASTDAWMAAAQAAGVKPLVAFNVNWATRNGYRKPPSIAAYRKSFRLVRERYPFVTDYSAWNEANHTAQPTAREWQSLCQNTSVPSASPTTWRGWSSTCPHAIQFLSRATTVPFRYGMGGVRA